MKNTNQNKKLKITQSRKNDFTYVLKTLYQDDIDKHERNGTIK